MKNSLLVHGILMIAMASSAAFAADKVVVIPLLGSSSTNNASYGSSAGAPDNAVFVDDNGNVGVGTMTPDAELQINKDQTSQTEFSLINPNGGGNASTVIAFYENEYQQYAKIFFVNSGNNIPLSPPGSFNIWNWAGDIWMRTSDNLILQALSSDGNVGIGTTTPAGRLDVNGTIYQRGSQLHADYVFNSDYKLESIEEHAQHMWKEKHLSSVPKAQYDENGLEILEMGSHRKGMLEELEKAHIYIDQLNIKVSALSALVCQNYPEADFCK